MLLCANWDLVAADHVTLNTDTLILRQTLQYGIDFNNIHTSGFYKYNGGPANTPNHGSGDFGMLLVMRSGNYISQICHQYNGDIHFYVRQSTDNGNTWSSWVS